MSKGWRQSVNKHKLAEVFGDQEPGSIRTTCSASSSGNRRQEMSGYHVVLSAGVNIHIVVRCSRAKSRTSYDFGCLFKVMRNYYGNLPKVSDRCTIVEQLLFHRYQRCFEVAFRQRNTR